MVTVPPMSQIPLSPTLPPSYECTSAKAQLAFNNLFCSLGMLIIIVIIINIY